MMRNLSGKFGMRLDEQRLEQPFVRLDLTLQFLVYLRARRGCFSFGTMSSISAFVR